MVSLRAKRLLCLMGVLLLISAAILPGFAENYPDISNLEGYYVLSGNRQFFSKPGGGYVLLSTDSEKQTLITLLDGNGNPDESYENISTGVAFVYEKAVISGNYIYIIGNDPSRAGYIVIARFSMNDGALVKNQIDDVSCDFSRGFSVDLSGNLYLVTVPYGTEFTSDSPMWVYIFDPSHNGANCDGSPVSNPVSSSAAASSGMTPDTSSVISSGAASGVTSDMSSGASSGSTSESSAANPYLFREAVTVEALQSQLDSDGRGAKVRVTAADGTIVKSGAVGTGSLVEVLLNGQVDSRVTAVILGDLTGSGTVAEQDACLLYEHITNQNELTGLYLKAADLNSDGKVNTSDMLLIKKLMNG